ncbi:MAG: CBS domain-containing protein [Methanomicrobiales archaeon]|nr:CBS domain-containing protein [Methanomicrobiales archaeon]
MNVRDIMTRDPFVVKVDTKVREAAGILRKRKIGGLPVMEGDRVAGVVTESDIISLLTVKGPSEDLWLPSPLEIIEVPIREYINWGKTKNALTSIGDMEVKEVMSSPAITIDADVDIEEAAALMLGKGIARLPVIEKGRLVGIVTRADIVRGVGQAFGAEQGNPSS